MLKFHITLLLLNVILEFLFLVYWLCGIDQFILFPVFDGIANTNWIILTVCRISLKSNTKDQKKCQFWLVFAVRAFVVQVHDEISFQININPCNVLSIFVFLITAVEKMLPAQLITRTMSTPENSWNWRMQLYCFLLLLVFTILGMSKKCCIYNRPDVILNLITVELFFSPNMAATFHIRLLKHQFWWTTI